MAQPNRRRSLAYRGPSRDGSCKKRNSHSNPDRCIHTGARLTSPARKSIVAPTPIETGTPSAR